MHCINLPSGGGADVLDCFDHDARAADFGSVAEVHREMLESTIEIDDRDLVMELSHYDIVPHLVQQKIAAEHKPGVEEP